RWLVSTVSRARAGLPGQASSQTPPSSQRRASVCGCGGETRRPLVTTADLAVVAQTVAQAALLACVCRNDLCGLLPWPDRAGGQADAADRTNEPASARPGPRPSRSDETGYVDALDPRSARQRADAPTGRPLGGRPDPGLGSYVSYRHA